MQVINRLYWLIIPSLILLQACVYEFYPKLDAYDDLLVVYGFITNENGPHEVRLSRSSTINGYAGIPENGATIKLFDDRGNSVDLTEKGGGLYVTPNSFSGEIGTKYKLSITLKDGKEYESEFVELIDVPNLTDIKAERGVKQATQTTPEAKGYQFYIDLDATNTTQKYYRWEMNDTWEIRMPYYITDYWTGDTLLPVGFPTRCWRSSKIQEIYIANTDDYESKKITNFPVTFTTDETEKLWIKYSLEVKQYALSEKGYYFWKGMLDNSQQKGTLFDKQPYQVIGNLKCLSNPDEIVLGFFEASAVKAKRIMIKSENLITPTSFELCKKIPASELTEQHYYRQFWMHNSTFEHYAVFDERCVDCTKTGSTPVMPDYWE